MKFLVLTQYYPPEVGAPQVRLAALVGELVRDGHQVQVVTALPNHPEGRIQDGYRRRLAAREQMGGADVRRVWMYAATGAGSRRLVSYLSFCATSMTALVRCQRPDVLFVESPPLFLGLTAVVMSAVWRRPIVFNVADLWPDSAVEMGMLKPGRVLAVVEWFERAVYRRSRWVNAVTEGIRDVLVKDKGVPLEKVTFLPNGVDIDLFHDGEPTADVTDLVGPGPAFLYAGTVGLAQGLDVGLDAMAIVRLRYPQATLLLLGGGSDRERLEARVQAERIDGVRFLDPVPPERVAEIYRGCVAGFASLKNLPIFDGARPSKIFPIMASARPVLYSGRGEGARLVGDNGAGIVCAPEDAESLATAMITLLEDPAEARRMGANGRLLVEREFSWGPLVRDWLGQLTPGLTSRPTR